MKFNLSFKKIKVTPGALLKLLPVGTLAVIIVILIWLVNFLYVYFYNTLTQAEEIYIYRSQISLKTIDMNLYNEVFSALESKKEYDQQAIDSLGNPFAETKKPVVKQEILPDEEPLEGSDTDSTE
ncbi:MAG: hypothetical protein WC575_00225 [Patescibacteria group bacterium]